MATQNPLTSAIVESSFKISSQPQDISGTKSKEEVLKVVRAACVSSMLEFYDFSLIGALADVIGDQFFPTSNKSLRLIESFMVFGSAFVFRPIGGALLGKFGDLYGRKLALKVSVALMMIPSFLVGCCPTYSDIQGWAPALLCILRIVQGIAAGGEFSSAAVFVYEGVNVKERGKYAGYLVSGANAGTGLGISVATAIRSSTNDQELDSWGWRIPFLLTPVIGGVALFFLNRLAEQGDEEYNGAKSKALQQESSSSSSAGDDKDKEIIEGMMKDNKMWGVLKKYPLEIILLMCSLGSWSPMVYAVVIWVPIYLDDFVDVGDIYDPFALNICFLLLFMALMPVFGMIADRVKDHYNNAEAYRYMMISGSVLACILYIPAFLLLQEKTLFTAIVGYFFLIIPLSMYGSSMFILCVELFEVLDRLTGVGYSYNLSHALWSSSITAALTALADQRGLTSPAYYLFGISAFSALVTSLGYSCMKSRKSRIKEEEPARQGKSSTLVGSTGGRV